MLSDGVATSSCLAGYLPLLTGSHRGVDCRCKLLQGGLHRLGFLLGEHRILCLTSKAPPVL